MTMTPAITLTATLQDIFGGVQGATGYPSRICITLAGYGQVLPRIIGTSMLARVGPTYLTSSTGSFSTLLYGNDVISPGGTYYAIEILDEDGNVVQSDGYEITGSGTQDLSDLNPILNPGSSTPSGYILVPSLSGALAISAGGWTGPLTIDITLTGNATLSLSGFTKGQLIQFIMRQNGVGGWSVTWPSSVKNPSEVNAAINSVSTQQMIVDYLLNLYPVLGWS
jgi:hypothetical protein